MGKGKDGRKKSLGLLAGNAGYLLALILSGLIVFAIVTLAWALAEVA